MNAADLRDEGIQLSLMAQEKADSGWADDAAECLWWYAKFERKFTSEDVRWYSLKVKKMPEPREPRAWGGIFAKALREGWIEHCGYEKSANPQAHLRPVSVWKGKA